jgi:hypothetical protein
VTFGLGSLSEGDYLQIWDTRVEVRRAALESLQITLDWKRRTAGSDGPESGDLRDLTLREGDRHLIDFADTTGCFKSVALELTAAIAEDDELTARRIGYDLWLVAEDDGQRTTRRWQVSGKHGERLDFDFGPVRTRFAKRPPGNGESDLFETTVGGHVRGRLGEGGLELAVMANRYTGPLDHTWVAGGYGEKLVRVAPGETIQLDLPGPRSIPRPLAAATREPDERAGHVLEALARQRVSLILTATPME